MPISTSNFGDDRDGRYAEYESDDLYEQETLEYPGVSLAQAETYLKRLGGGVDEKLVRVEGIGWHAEITPLQSDATHGVAVTFNAHDELLDDLIRRFEDWVDRGE
ncbi:MAG: hypothetical protein H6642_02775 [Caldilineaceae bacterium]|nr:hypothetical protein [Caldilineaceae bacterium]